MSNTQQFVNNKAVDQLSEVYESSENKEKMQEIKEFIAELEAK